MLKKTRGQSAKRERRCARENSDFAGGRLKRLYQMMSRQNGPFDRYDIHWKLLFGNLIIRNADIGVSNLESGQSSFKKEHRMKIGIIGIDGHKEKWLGQSPHS
jgi:hypothetical protein